MRFIGVALTLCPLCFSLPGKVIAIEPPAAEHGWSVGYEQPSAVEPSLKLPPLDEMLFPSEFRHADPNDPHRHVGIGQPLSGASWRTRPFHVGWLFGGMWGDTLVENNIDQRDDSFGGYRVGWDFDHYWGTEARFSFADMATNVGTVHSRNRFGDVSLAYYPWGDAKWRPFAAIGLGAADFRFRDRTGAEIRELLLTTPLSIGTKYYWKKWLTLRTTLTDNIAIGNNGIETMHNISWTTGIEVHFGGPRISYFPHHAGGYLW